MKDFVPSARPSSITLGAFGVLQILSAGLTSLVIFQWIPPFIVWFALVPFFLAPIKGQAAIAAFLGALWGATLCLLLCVFGDSPNSVESWQSVLLLIVVPAAYAWLVGVCSKLRAGFNPLFAGLAWVGLELALRPIGLPLGLVANSQHGNELIASLVPLLGYALVSFIVATVNAYVAKKLLEIKIAPSPRRPASSPRPTPVLRCAELFLVWTFPKRTHGARAPPSRCALTR